MQNTIKKFAEKKDAKKLLLTLLEKNILQNNYCNYSTILLGLAIGIVTHMLIKLKMKGCVGFSLDCETLTSF